MSDPSAAGTTAPSHPVRRGRLSGIARSLSHRNFRLFFVGQSVSLLGTWIQQTAMLWLVTGLAEAQGLNSALYLGVTGFASQIAVLLVAPFAGVLSDRWNRHRIVIATQTLSMLQAFLLAILTFTHLITVGQIIALSLALGVINAFDMPTRQAFMMEMVDSKEDLANAIALNSSMVNGARLIGPSIAGILIDLVGEALCFLLNGLSYLGVIAALLAMRIRRHVPQTSAPSLFRGLREGLIYAFGFAPVRSILLLVALMGLVGLPYAVLMPVIASQILHGGARTLGLLMGSSGVGALAGSLYLAARGSVVGLGRWIAGTASLFGIALVAFSLSRNLIVSTVCLAFMGFSMMVQLASCNTILQTIVDEEKRGRAMSLYTAAFLGMTPLGSLIAGTMAARVGVPLTLRLGGICCIVGGVLFAMQLPTLRRIVRPIYAQMGILPVVAAGMQTATEPAGFPPASAE